MEDILTSNEVAQLINRHLVTVYRYKEEGLLVPTQTKEHGRLEYTLQGVYDYYKGKRTMAELQRDLLKIREANSSEREVANNESK